MADNELLIKINADAANLKKAYTDVKAQTSDLESSLQSVALVSGVAFAAFTSEIFLSVQAFQEAERASKQLNIALQNQGIFTAELREEYDKFAKVVSAKTGIDDDAITKAQAVAQTFLGQTQVTQELTQSVADLSASLGGDLNGAAEKIGKTIGTSVNAFRREGLVLDENLTKQERYAKVLEFVSGRYAGLAEETERANGFQGRLATSFGNLQERIGERFFPLISAVRKGLADFFDVLSNNQAFATIAVAIVGAGAAITGLVTVAAIAVPAFTALAAAASAAGISVGVALGGIPLAIGGIVAALAFLGSYFGEIMASISAVSQAAFTFIAESFAGLAKAIQGFAKLDFKQVKEGLRDLGGAFGKAKEDAVNTFNELTAQNKKFEEQQNAEKERQANERERKARERQAILVAIQTGEVEIFRLQNENASKEVIALKQREIETLKTLEQEKTGAELSALQTRLQITRELLAEAQNEELERARAFAVTKAELQAELSEQEIEVSASLSAAKLAEIQATEKTAADIDRDVQEEILRTKINARNRDLLDRKKYGVTVAALNKVLNSEEVQGAKAAAGELTQLQTSKNATLKAIGKAAAVAQITIATGESAMNIYRGFSTIPIIGPALGIAGAAAAVAFGAERIGQVTAAADGGLITGGIPGQDSVPALLMPGELVVPERNFEQVVGAVRGDSGSNQTEMLDALNRLEQKISTPQTTIIQGDVTADDSFVDSLIRRINDAVEFRNAQLTVG